MCDLMTFFGEAYVGRIGITKEIMQVAQDLLIGSVEEHA